MRTLHRIALVICLAAPLWPAIAHEFRAGPITIDDPWARASIGAAGNTAAYMKLANGGEAPDRLVAVKSDVAAHVSLHESREDNGIMKMAPVAGIEVPAGGNAELKPLGLHVMLTGLNRPLKAGETFPMTLVFEKQGEVPVEVSVQQAQGPAAAGHEMHHHE
jgi:periplasmic copper chaperone A